MVLVQNLHQVSVTNVFCLVGHNSSNQLFRRLCKIKSEKRSESHPARFLASCDIRYPVEYPAISTRTGYPVIYPLLVIFLFASSYQKSTGNCYIINHRHYSNDQTSFTLNSMNATRIKISQKFSIINRLKGKVKFKKITA